MSLLTLGEIKEVFMTIDEAIERLVKLQIDDLPLPRHQDWQAVQLGIEALKGIKKVRKTFRPYVEALLPGEIVA